MVIFGRFILPSGPYLVGYDFEPILDNLRYGVARCFKKLTEKIRPNIWKARLGTIDGEDVTAVRLRETIKRRGIIFQS